MPLQKEIGEHQHSMIPKVPETTTTCCSTSNDMVVMSKSHNLDTREDGASRGVRKQKYPLDDYLINSNMQKYTQAPLLSPLSPVSSPETVDVLQNAERLVKSAKEQIMEVSLNSVLNTLNDNHPSYIGPQPLDDSLFHIREMIDSKFQECKDPDKIYTRKVPPSNIATSNRKLQRDQFPVKESSGMPNKPLEISKQDSEIFASQMARGIFLQNEKPFFKKAPNWFMKIKPPEHITVFPTSTTNNFRSKTQSSPRTPRCTMTNTRVIEIDGRDTPNGTIQVQTGPTVDIQRGLTIQTIENVHISPDPSSVPIYNNVATYCFQHKPSTSTSYVDLNRIPIDKHSVTGSGARNVLNTCKERQIQSTDYNDMQKAAHIQNTQNTGTTVIKDLIQPSHDTDHNTIGMQPMLSYNSNNPSHNNNDHMNRDEIDLSNTRNKLLSYNNVVEGSNLHKSSMVDEVQLRSQKTLRTSVNNTTEGTRLTKAVSINLTPINTSVYEEFPLTNAEAKSENKEENFGKSSPAKDDYEISSNMEFRSLYGDQKFHHVQSDKDYVERLQMCGNECKTGSCSRNCERDVEYREKQKLKEALEIIANIEKLRFDMKDTGIVPAECTQICVDRNHCNADAVNLEFAPFSEPERFKTALENLCKFSENTEASKIDINSQMYRGAIDSFVKTIFDSTSQSNLVHELYSSDQDLENVDVAPRQNDQSEEGNDVVKGAEVERKKEEAKKTLKPVKLIPEMREIEYRQQLSKIVKPKINSVAIDNLSNIKNNTLDAPVWQFCTGRLKEPNKYSKPLVQRNDKSPKDKVTQQEKALSQMGPNEEEYGLTNLELKQPCLSDVDGVLKTYRESLAAICRGTEQLSQLISHHIMKNALSTSDQISSPPIPNCSVILHETDVKSRDARNEEISSTSVLNLVSDSSEKFPGKFISVYQKNSTHQPKQIQPTEVTHQKHERGRIPQREYPNVSKDDAESSNENNSVCTNETPVSSTKGCSSVCSRSLAEQAKALSVTNENSSTGQFNVANDKSNFTSTSKVYQQAPVNIRTQSAPSQRKTVKNMRKGGKQFMNVQYCVAEPFERPIPIEFTSAEKNPLQSDSKSPLSTYLNLENACSQDKELRRHSDYDIHSNQTEGLKLYKCPVWISEQRVNFDFSNNNPKDKFKAAESVVQTKEIELQVFRQILDAVKNSSQFMKQVVISLFNGMEIDSINNIVRNLEEAAVQPIVIEQLLVMLREKNTDKSLFGGSLMLTNSAPAIDDWKKSHNEPKNLAKTNDNINSFKHSIGFNGSIDTTNIQINKADEDPAVLNPAGNQITTNSDPTPCEKNCGQIKCEMILENHHAEEKLKNSNDNLEISNTIVENKSCLSKSLLTLSCGILQAPETEDTGQRKPQRDDQGAEEKSLDIEHCQSNNTTSKEQNNMNECFKNSIYSNVTSKKNDSEGNTDEDISFLIPHDADMNNGVVDSSSVQKLTSVTLKNETTGEIIGFHIESNCRNGLRLDSLIQERSTKINSNTDPEQSSVTSQKTSGKMQSSDDSTLNHRSFIKNPQKDGRNIICHCRKPKDHNEPNTESHHVPCESSLDAVNSRIDFHIQSNYKQLGLIEPEERVSPRIADNTTPTNATRLNRRPRPSKLSATSTSPMRKANDLSKTGGKKKKSFGNKVRGDKKILRDNIQDSAQGVKNTKHSDSEKSDYKNACPLCMELQGKCSCLNYRNYNTNSNKPKKISPRPKKEKAKFGKNITSPCQSGSFKRSVHTTGKYSLRRKSNPISNELSSRLIPASLESGKNNINNKVQNSTRAMKDTPSMARKSKLKPSAGMFSSNSTNIDGLMNRKTKPRMDKKLLQDTASDSDNIKVVNKSQNTAKSADVTACKCTKTHDTVTSSEIIVCKSLGSLCKKIPILDKAKVPSPTMLDETAEINTVNEPSVKEASELQYVERSSLTQHSPADHRNTCCDKMNITEEQMTECTEIKDFSTISSQTLEILDKFQNNQPNLLETTPEAGTASVFKKPCPKIFDESIIVLQPLNELEHTFFIVKPNCGERKIIQEKLNKRSNIEVREMTDHDYPAVYESNEHDEDTNNREMIDHDYPPVYKSNQNYEESNKKLTYSSSEIVEPVDCADKSTSKNSFQLNSTASTTSCVKNKECQVSCPSGTGMDGLICNKQSSVTDLGVTDSNVSISEDNEECADLCINDDECLRICPQPSADIDNLRFHCERDCPQEEICLKLCPPIPEAKSPLQTNSININGILKKFIAENNVPNVKLPIVKGLLEELKNVENSLRAENEKFSEMHEESESQNDHDKAGMKDAGKLIEGAIPRCKEKGSHQKSVQYEEPHEKMKHIMMNRKSLNLPNVVRGIADMHPSTKLEHLKLRTADPIVSGSFNKPESDKRYSVFNQADPICSSIDLNDPRTVEYLASTTQWMKVQEGEKSSSDSSIDVVPSAVMKITKKTSTVEKSTNNNVSKLNKSRRGMDADFNFLVRLNETSVNSIKSFESSDLEPGEFLQVRTPFDNPIKSCQYSERINLEIGQVSQNQAKCNSLYNNDLNNSPSVRTLDCTNIQEITINQQQFLGNRYELFMDSTEVVEGVYTRNSDKSNSDKFVDESGIFTPNTVTIANGSQKIVDKSVGEFGVLNHQLISAKDERSKYITTNDPQLKIESTHEFKSKKNSKVESSVSIRKASFTDMEANVFKLTERYDATDDSKSSEINNSHSLKKHKDSHGIIYENLNIQPLQKYSQPLSNDIEYNNRPQIIDHFLGKTKLEDMKIEYSHNKTDIMSEECQSLRDNCQRLYLKSDFTSKTTPDSENGNITENPNASTTRNDAIQLNFSRRRCRETTNLGNSNQTTSKRWDHTSSDTYSEGEINLASSCSYSLGEVKISTPNSTTPGKSFRDPDGLTIFVTKSILDATHGTCTSPGEILADIQKTESDLSSIIS